VPIEAALAIQMKKAEVTSCFDADNVEADMVAFEYKKNPHYYLNPSKFL